MAMNKALITGIVLVIVAIIVIFTIVGNTAADIKDASESITDANNCTDGSDAAGTAWFYNSTGVSCANATNGSIYPAGYNRLPLSNLFATNSVIILVFMSAIFLTSLILVIKKFRQG